jgi:hypothetical protein
VMQVARSGFYASIGGSAPALLGLLWRRRPKSNRAQQDEALTRQIQTIHGQNRGVYGAPRVHAELYDQQVRASRKRVARLMRLAGLEGKRKGSHKRKRSPGSTPTASNLLAFSSAATQPDQVWVSDITYLRTAEGWELGPKGRALPVRALPSCRARRLLPAYRTQARRFADGVGDARTSHRNPERGRLQNGLSAKTPATGFDLPLGSWRSVHQRYFPGSSYSGSSGAEHGWERSGQRSSGSAKRRAEGVMLLRYPQMRGGASLSLT